LVSGSVHLEDTQMARVAEFEAPVESEHSDYSTEEESGSDAEKGKEVGTGFPFLAESRFIPHRMQQVLTNWIFIFASIFLILDFLSLHLLVRALMDPELSTGPFAELCNWFGVLSCLGWFSGFALLAHWLHSVGATSMGLAGCYLKLVASVFFNLQPMTGTMNDVHYGGSAGLWWSNLTGILFFHVGNLVSCLDFFLHVPPGADKSKGWLFHGNLPVTAMWVYQAATWLLVAANFMSCSFAGIEGAKEWAPLVPVVEAPVYFCQLGGGFLLLLGSIIYVTWCAGFHDMSH